MFRSSAMLLTSSFRRVVVAVVLAALLGSACSSASEEVSSAVAAFDEFDARAADPVSSRQRMVEYRGVVEKCMAERGFTLSGEPVPPLSWFEDQGRSRLFASVNFLLTMTYEDVSELGLDFAGNIGAEATGNLYELLPFPNSEDDDGAAVAGERLIEYLSALDGFDGGVGDAAREESCVGLANAEVGSVDPPQGDAELAESLEKAMTEGEFVQLIGQWQACLAEAGFPEDVSPISWGSLYYGLTEIFTEQNGSSPADLISSIGLAKVLELAAPIDAEYGAEFVRCREGLGVSVSEEFQKLLAQLD